MLICLRNQDKKKKRRSYSGKSWWEKDAMMEQSSTGGRKHLNSYDSADVSVMSVMKLPLLHPFH